MRFKSETRINKMVVVKFFNNLSPVQEGTIGHFQIFFILFALQESALFTILYSCGYPIILSLLAMIRAQAL